MESVIAEEGTQEMDILARKVNEVLSTRDPFLESPRNFSVPRQNLKSKPVKVPKTFFGIRDFPYLKFGIRDFKEKCGEIRDSKIYARVRMPKITLGITGLHEISGRDYGIEEPYWRPSAVIY